jgi:hypothetical protein
MSKTRIKAIIILLIIIAPCMCIDPYSPKLNGSQSFLVVEGLVTDENASCVVKITRTMQTGTSIPEKVSDASLFITDDTGNKIILNNSGNGLYKTDSTLFTGAAGETYALHILTENGNEYISEPCLMLPVPEIDSIYYVKDKEFTNNQSEIQEGIRIYLDSKEGDEINQYFRWEFEETWKFRVPMPKRYNYIDSATILPVDVVNEFCWKQQKSSEILIKSISPGQPHVIKKEPFYFIASDKSDRLTIQYSILIKQYSMSKKESDFWDNLKQVNEGGGDIFDPQPFPVISNIYNVNNPSDRVLGYFQVSAVKQKRKYITFNEIVGLNLPFFRPDCERIEYSPDDWPGGWGPPMTWAGVYKMFDNPRFTFIEPLYESGTNILKELVFTSPVCANCELTGTSKKPDFWIDLN